MSSTLSNVIPRMAISARFSVQNIVDRTEPSLYLQQKAFTSLFVVTPDILSYDSISGKKWSNIDVSKGRSEKIIQERVAAKEAGRAARGGVSARSAAGRGTGRVRRYVQGYVSALHGEECGREILRREPCSVTR
jgi:hypothetical protein